MRMVKIATTSLATLEDTAPPYNLRYPDPADNLRLGLAMLDGAGAQGADLAILPEGFVAAGLPGSRLPEVAEPLDGAAVTAVRARARAHGMYVVAGFYTKEHGRIFNRALLVDRDGAVVGSYAKRHPTEGEIDSGVVPGAAAAVFDTDFGRVGLAICFDLNWPQLWADMQRKGAEIVCWISAYDGGFPLQAYAWMHQYVIASSVWPYHSRIVDRLGRIVAQTSRWGRLALSDVNLEKRLFHTDGQMQKLLPLQTEYGPRIRIETFGEEHLFTLESLDPTLDVDAVIAAHQLVEYQPFIDRCTRAQNAARERVPEPAE
jgi:predicted amidohydrolase